MSEKPPQQTFHVNVSRGFPELLRNLNASIAVTTYQVGKLFLFGTKADGSFWIFNRNIGRCLGMAHDESGFWTSADVQLVRYENILRESNEGPQGSDAFFAPRHSYYTGDLDIHDVAIDKNGDPIFVNTLFNCLARPSQKYSFEPVWKPPFITRLAAEDRCHLNGLAMVNGTPKYVTATSNSDIFDGWREHRVDGGLVIDVETNEIVCTGLSMPHSPRWYRDRLWLHNSGTGEFGYIELTSGKFRSIAFCPGYLRGLDFIGDFAVVGLSKPRGNTTFSGLPLDNRLSEQNVAARCAIYFVNIKTGDVSHSIQIEGTISELYDVSVLSGSRQPAMLGPNSSDLKRTISLP